MRWSPKRPKIGPLDGFKETDLFEYREFGEHLAKLIGSLEDHPVLVLDGRWGSGKTTFADQLAGVLRQDGHAVAYFDAFAVDHHKDPFLALVEEVHCLATEADVGSDSDALHRFTTATVAVVKELGLTTVEAAIPVAGPLLRLAIEAGSKEEESLLKTWLQEAAARKKAIVEFRERLEEVAKALAASTTTNDQGSAIHSGSAMDIRPRLVFIVDELDRCRPTFALSLLERIKHVFGVEGVTFVLVANLKELGKSVLRVYGDVDETRYLEKFFEIVVRLPEGDRLGNNMKVSRYIHHLFRQLNFPNDVYSQRCRDFLCAIAAPENLSLRTLEHVMRSALVLAPSAPPYVVALLPIVRVTRPDLFAKMARGRQDLFTDSEKGDLIALANRIGSEDEGDTVFSQLQPNSEWSYFARLLEQYRVR